MLDRHRAGTRAWILAWVMSSAMAFAEGCVGTIDADAGEVDSSAPELAPGTSDAEITGEDADGPDGADSDTSPDDAKLLAGEACAVPEDCASGFCVDGVCCGSECDGICRSCAVPGKAGTCSSAPAGTDPRDDCPDDGLSACGRDGTCDGVGACRLYRAGTICRAPRCVGETLHVGLSCDGQGHCSSDAPLSCAPYRCGYSACLQSCTSDTDCTVNTFCVAGSCGAKPSGATCTADGQCSSSFCRQGRCCETDCSGTCRSCALPSREGVCSLVPDGADPLGHCADQGAASCGTDGACDGAGACRRYTPGTACGGPRCLGSTYTPASSCDSLGTCVTPAAQACGTFGCNAAGCRSSCAGDLDCATGFFCVNGSCALKLNGSACGGDAQCSSGFCRQGRCCETDCSGTCLSCALPAKEGVCSTVPDGADPLGHCADQGAASCGADGACDGAGACRRYSAGTVCAAPICQGPINTPAATCDGAGTCVSPASVSCGNYRCSGASCPTSCSLDSQCVAPATCIAGHCDILSVVGHYAALTTTSSTSAIRYKLSIENDGTVALLASDLKVRYWFTRDGQRLGSVTCSSAALGCNNVSVSVSTLSSSRTDADAYAELSFGSGAGSFTAGGSSGEISLQISSKDNNFDQTNDYSYDLALSISAPAPRLTIYRNGQLLWGAEP